MHSVNTLKELGYESIIINSNPETVSTDFDTSDKLYFEPLTKECVLDIIDKEKPEGVIVQFGGQTAINLAQPIHCLLYTSRIPEGCAKAAQKGAQGDRPVG